MVKKILILGITGMLGSTLFKSLNENSSLEIYGTVRKNIYLLQSELYKRFLSHIYTDVDAFNLVSISEVVALINPDVVINCVGIIKQLSLSNDPLTCISINSSFPHQLEKICCNYQSKLIHISTDCIFSGNKGNYIETDAPDPSDLYGRTKLLGEVTKGNSLTLRTSIIGREINTQYGLVEWFISQKNKIVRGYDRAIYTGFTTQALAQIIERIILEQPNLEGLWHISSDPITKYQLLNMMNQAFNLGITIEKDESFICDRSLNSQKFRNFTSYTPPTWEEMIAQLAASQ